MKASEDFWDDLFSRLTAGTLAGPQDSLFADGTEWRRVQPRWEAYHLGRRQRWKAEVVEPGDAPAVSKH